MEIKKIEVVSNKWRGDFERELEKVIVKMNNEPTISKVEIQFSTASLDNNTTTVMFSALVIGKGVASV
jgi:hypothetical protein